MKRITLIIALFLLAALAGCAAEPAADGTAAPAAYAQIDQETARQMMERDDGHVILDVRRAEEYAAGHIPGAILLPNESIGTERPPELPDLEQIILIYCRSGNRSKQAAQKLLDMGYTNIYEFGGILTWTGELETEEEAAMRNTPTGAPVRPAPMLVLEVGERRFYASLEDNDSARAFIEQLSPEAIEVEMQDYGGFEKVGALPWALPRSDEEITTRPGDVILYQGDRITLYYGQNTWSLTRLARIGNVTGEELLEALGDGAVTIRFWLEWSE